VTLSPKRYAAKLFLRTGKAALKEVEHFDLGVGRDEFEGVTEIAGRRVVALAETGGEDEHLLHAVSSYRDRVK
jgi:hypothetical protein